MAVNRTASGASHAVVPNEKNKHILVGMRDGVTAEFKLVPKKDAVVSVFDSNFLIGDGIWEGIRAKNGRIQFAKEHIDRLFQSAKAMMMDLGLSKIQLLNLLHRTVDANNMSNEPHVHIRLVVSRGLKSTPYQNPTVNIGLPLIVIIPEIKATDPNVKSKGLRLVTSHIRRGPPDVKDEMWNHISKATDVQACISANVAGVDEALMLDLNGFVKTCNSTNFFIVRNGEVWAPTKNNQMQGITRQKSIDVCRANGIPIRELDFTLTEVYGADEAFCTGTFPSQLHVVEVDGRQIGDGMRGPVTERIQQLYSEAVQRDTERSRSEIETEVVVFLQSRVSELLDLYHSQKVGYIDSITESYAIKNNEIRRAITPSIIRHVGRQSSKSETGSSGRPSRFKSKGEMKGSERL